jgi:hypothetical protein
VRGRGGEEAEAGALRGHRRGDGKRGLAEVVVVVIVVIESVPVPVFRVERVVRLLRLVLVLAARGLVQGGCSVPLDRGGGGG